jgi:lincosamide and streptogramin A transport system ATP-binding/permease protein
MPESFRIHKHLWPQEEFSCGRCIFGGTHMTAIVFMEVIMANIAITNLTFAWDGSAENVFEDLSFHFDTDWRIGLIGRNGRGKTTLLKLLAGELPHGGAISAPVRFRYFPYLIEDSKQNTVDVVDEVCPVHEFWELCCEMNLLGVSQEVLFRPFETLSFGERAKVLMATLFLGHGDFVLLDEPTNHLDVSGKQAISEYLCAKRGFLIVSHDRVLLDAVCDHTIAIGTGGIEVQNGSYSIWAEEKRRRDARELAMNAQLAKDVARLETAARAARGWSDKVEETKTGHGPVDRGYVGHKSAKMMKRSKSLTARRETTVTQKTGLLKEIEQTGTLKMSPLTHHKDILVEAENLSIDYLPEFSRLNMWISQGSRIALTGDNGSGKSSVLKVLMGEHIPHKGVVRSAGGLIVSYVPQDASWLLGNIRAFATGAGVDLTRFLTILRAMGVPREDFAKDLPDLSDGIKRKTLLAKSLCESAHLYIWDEPLNYLDILSREQIEEVILAYAPTMIFVEHDETFMSRVATETIRVGKDG